jgi:sepiapterin reductase
MKQIWTTNCVILVTGAGKGIGKATVEKFAQKAVEHRSFRPRFFLTSRTESDLVALQKLLKEKGLEGEIWVSELSSREAAETVVSKCIERFGRVDVLVANAGVGRFGDLLTLTENDFDHTIGTNLKGFFFLIQNAFRAMKDQPPGEDPTLKGHIFGITSVAGHRPYEQSGLYCISKYGQRGLMDVLKLYGHQNQIRVTEIAPGATHTPMWGEVTDDMKNRMMLPEDIGEIIAEAYLKPSRASIETILVRPISGDL